MSIFQTLREPFPEPVDLRKRLYRGQIFKLPTTFASLQLVESVESLVLAIFSQDYRNAQLTADRDSFLAKVRKLKDQTYESVRIRELTVRLLESHGFRADQYCFDPPRLRAIAPDSDLIPAAAPALNPHRDTWYANPQAQINWWIPLHNVSEKDSFSFYLKYFNAPVANDSELFNYGNWIKTVGFGNSSTGKGGLYPAPNAPILDDSPQSFRLDRGEILLFAAAHLHATNGNATELTRFSIDFRMVNKQDHAAGIGAPNTDNKSTGDAYSSYYACSIYSDKEPVSLQPEK